MPENQTTEEEIPAIALGAEDAALSLGDGEDDNQAEPGDAEPGAAKDPAEGAEAEKPGDEANPSEQDKLEVEFNGEKITLAELKDLAEKGADYTQKTQELADKEREFETRAGNATIAENLADELFESPESARQAIAKLQSVAANAHGDKWNSSPSFTDQELSEMDDIEKKMVADNAATREEIRLMRNDFATAMNVLKEAKPLLEETVSAKTTNAEIALVKASLGIEITPGQLTEARQKSGQKDAVAAVAVWNRNREKTEEAKAKTPTPPKTPEGRPREVSSNDSSNPDDIFRQARSAAAAKQD